MANLKVNGHLIGGEVYALKPGTLPRARAAAEHDGLDEVFFHSDGRDYVAMAPALDDPLETRLRSGGAEVELDTGRSLKTVQLIGVDRETHGTYTSLSDATSAWKRAGLGRVALGAFVTAGGAWGATASIRLAAHGVSQLGSHTALGVAAGVGKTAGGSVGAVVLGLAAIGGVALAINGARQLPKAAAFEAQEQHRASRKITEAPLQAYLDSKVD